MRKIVLKIIAPFIQGFAKFYFSKPRKYNYGTIKGLVLPGVFYPHFTLSTRILMEFIEGEDLSDKSLLELGSGTGMISVLAAKKGARVLASDINPKAIENTRINAKKNGVELKALLSDLFEAIPPQFFDYMIINPPYYPKKPANVEERAWYCGENFEYFERLFSTLDSYSKAHTKIYMILSEDCEIDRMREIGERKGYDFILALEKKKWGELNFIFQIKKYLNLHK